MAVDTRKYLEETLIFVKLFGCWSPRGKLASQIYKIYGAIMFVVFIAYTPIAAIIYFITAENIGVAEIADSVYMVAELTAYVFRMWFWLKHEELIKETMSELNGLAFNQQHPEQDEYLKWSAIKAQRFYRAFLGCCIWALFAWASVPFFSEKRILPLNIWYPFDPLENTAIYAITYLHIFFGVAGCTVINISTGPLAVGLMIQATGQLQVLKNSFERLTYYAKELNNGKTPASPEEMDNLVYQKIIKYVEHHHAIIEFVNKIEVCFGSYAFAQFMAGSSIICLTAVELTITSPTNFKFVWMLSFMICMLIELLQFCWFGTELYYESLHLMDGIYTSDWYTYGPKSKKALFIIMERSKRPLRVQAAKLFDLSLETYTKILRGAYSLFTVLEHLMHTNKNLQQEFGQ